MPAAINTAAKFYDQHNVALDLTSYVPLNATITSVFTGGSRVTVVITDPSQLPQTPSNTWRTRNIPYLEGSAEAPTSGPFVAATSWTPPSSGSGSSGSGSSSGDSSGSDSGSGSGTTPAPTGNTPA